MGQSSSKTQQKLSQTIQMMPWNSQQTFYRREVGDTIEKCYAYIYLGQDADTSVYYLQFLRPHVSIGADSNSNIIYKDHGPRYNMTYQKELTGGINLIFTHPTERDRLITRYIYHLISFN